MHYDVSCNFFTNILGRKRVLLFPIDDMERLYLYPFARYPEDTTSQINFQEGATPVVTAGATTAEATVEAATAAAAEAVVAVEAAAEAEAEAAAAAAAAAWADRWPKLRGASPMETVVGVSSVHALTLCMHPYCTCSVCPETFDTQPFWASIRSRWFYFVLKAV
jgi:hypothetical protein